MKVTPKLKKKLPTRSQKSKLQLPQARLQTPLYYPSPTPLILFPSDHTNIEVVLLVPQCGAPESLILFNQRCWNDNERPRQLNWPCWIHSLENGLFSLHDFKTWNTRANNYCFEMIILMKWNSLNNDFSRQVIHQIALLQKKGCPKLSKKAIDIYEKCVLGLYGSYLCSPLHLHQHLLWIWTILAFELMIEIYTIPLRNYQLNAWRISLESNDLYYLVYLVFILLQCSIWVRHK